MEEPDYDEDVGWGEIFGDVIDPINFRAPAMAVPHLLNTGRTRVLEPPETPDDLVGMQFVMQMRVFARSIRAMKECARIHGVLVAQGYGIPARMLYPEMHKLIVEDNEELFDGDADDGAEE